MTATAAMREKEKSRDLGILKDVRKLLQVAGAEQVRNVRERTRCKLTEDIRLDLGWKHSLSKNFGIRAQITLQTCRGPFLNRIHCQK